MYFLYCKECDNLRPRGWVIFTKRCEMCHGTMEKIKVKMTPIAPFYYVSIVAMIGLLILYMDNWVLPFGVWSVVFLTGLTMVLAFIDYNMSYKMVLEMLEKRVAPEKAGS